MDIPFGTNQHLALRERLVAAAAATYHHLSASDVPPAEVLERMAQAHFDAARIAVGGSDTDAEALWIGCARSLGCGAG